MDALTRWSIALGFGAAAFCAAVFVATQTTHEALQESREVAAAAVLHEYPTLDVEVELTTFDPEKQTEFFQLLLEAGAREFHYENCDNPPASACTTSTVVPGELLQRSVTAPVIQDGLALTIGHYSAEASDIIRRAHTARVDIGGEPVELSLDGNGFSITNIERGAIRPHNEPWQFALAAVPLWVTWALAAGLAALVTFLIALIIRERPDGIDVIYGTVPEDGDPLDVFAPLMADAR